MYYYFIGVNEYLCCKSDDTLEDFINDNVLCLKCKILENNYENNYEKNKYLSKCIKRIRNIS